MKHSRLFSVFAVLALVAVAVAPTGAQAHHSIPSPIQFWDPNDNGVPGPDPDFDYEGPGWLSGHIARLYDATAEWTSDTDWDPGVANTAYNVYVDGHAPSDWCLDNSSWAVPGGEIAAVACVDTSPRVGYLRIIDTDIFFNTARPTSPDWWIGDGLPPDATRLHFGGVLTHELGHSVYLHDLNGCPHTNADWFTMCHQIVAGSEAVDSYRMRTLHADDIEGANNAYP